MGMRYRLSCSKCNYKKEFDLGSGLGSINLYRNLRLFSEEEQKAILFLKEQKRIGFFQIVSRLSWCEHCEELLEKAFLEMEGNDEKRYIFGNYCNICGNELKAYEKSEIEQIFCPECGEIKLDIKEIGYWD